jgi:AcrR family transcriptional regulator
VQGEGRADVSPLHEAARPASSGDPVRDRIAAAMVDLVGSHGYEATAIEAVCERAGIARADFDRRFADKEDCFLGLHDEIAAELCLRIDAAYATPTAWHNRIWAAGWAAMRFLQQDPVRARFFIVELNGVGERAQKHRDRLLQRLADLFDDGREQLADPASASRCSAEIVAGSIYGATVTKVRGGWVERGEHFLPELIYMAMLPYLGARAAEDELLVQPLQRPSGRV